MPIYLEGGQILLDGGAIAVHEDCCCGDVITTCQEFVDSPQRISSIESTLELNHTIESGRVDCPDIPISNIIPIFV